MAPTYRPLSPNVKRVNWAHLEKHKTPLKSNVNAFMARPKKKHTHTQKKLKPFLSNRHKRNNPREGLFNKRLRIRFAELSILELFRLAKCSITLHEIKESRLRRVLKFCQRTVRCEKNLWVAKKISNPKNHGTPDTFGGVNDSEYFASVSGMHLKKRSLTWAPMILWGRHISQVVLQWSFYAIMVKRNTKKHCKNMFNHCKRL